MKEKKLALQPRICTCNQLAVIAPAGVSAREVREAIDGTWMSEAVDVFLCSETQRVGFCSKCGKGFTIPRNDILECAFVFVHSE
jgi:hypothetical protein